MWMNEYCSVMCRRRWNLWLLTVTIGFWMICFNGRTAMAIARWTNSTTNASSNYVNKVDANGKNTRVPETTWASTVGYAAEWDYEGGGFGAAEEYDDPLPTRKLSDSGNSIAVPSKRVGPGTWQGANGSWWMFGGQGPMRSNSSSTAATEGLSTSIQFLSDLWLYDKHGVDSGQEGGAGEEKDSELSWRLVYSPRSDSASPISSYPDSIAFPVLCGSELNGHLAVFGGGSNPSGDSRAHNSPFVEDNIVWLYDIPRNGKQQLRPPQKKKSGIEESDNESSMESTAGEGEVEWTYQQPWNGTEGLWTSYICCDACLPDGNTTLEFCPQFSGDPILWCGQDSLMALQFTSPPMPKARSPTAITETTHYNGGQQYEEKEKTQLLLADSVTTDGVLDMHPEMPPSEGKSGERGSYNNSNTDGYWEKGQRKHKTEELEGKTSGRAKRSSPESEKEEIGGKGRDEEINIENKKPGKDDESKGWRMVNWWKFDLGATEWIKMPEVNISVETAKLMSAGGCRTVDDGDCVYILCPTVIPTASAESTVTMSSGTARQNLLSRTVLLFDPKSVSIRFLGQIALNNAFRDRKVWQLGRSVFHALRSDNHTVIFLAYHKLLDLWIHDHQSNAVYAVENVWKGSSLHIFQRTTSFYKLSISLPSPFLKNSLRDVDSRPDEFLRRNYSFYMVNPRTKLFSFDDPQPAARFHITIVTDKSVFLPSRDASFLIKTATADTVVNKNDDSDKSSLSGISTKEIENISASTTVTTYNITTIAPAINTNTTGPKEMKTNFTISTIATGSNVSTTATPTTTSTEKMAPDMIMIKKANKASLKLIPKVIPKAKLKLAFISAVTRNSTNNKTTGKSLARNSNSNASLVVEGNKDKDLPSNHITTNEIALSIDSVTKATPFASTTSVTEKATLQDGTVGSGGSSPGSGGEIGEWTKRLSWRSKSNLSRNHSHNETNNSELKSMGKVRVATATAVGTGTAWTARTTLNKKHILGIKQTFAGVIDPAKRTKGNGKGLAVAASPASSLALNNERPKSSFALKSLNVGPRRTLEMPRTPNDTQHGNSNLTQEHSLLQLPVSTVNSSNTVKKAEMNDTTATSAFPPPHATTEAKLISTPEKPISFTSTEMSGHEHSLHSTTISSSVDEIAPFDSGGDSQSDADKSWSESSSRILQLQSDRKSVVHGFVDGDPETETEGTKMNSPELIEDVSTSSTVSGRARARNEEIMADEEETGQSPLTYGSSEIMIESRDDIRSIGQEGTSLTDSAYSSMLFFSISLTIFATFGVVLFFRRCVKCPPRRQSVLIKEPPPIQYSVIPDELSYHTPVV